jgi:hypothetical protein
MVMYAMPDIKDLFGEFSTPFKKLEIKKLADRMEEARRKQRKMHITKNCSDCESEQAWYSSDHGLTWQCHTHKKD